MKTVSIITPTYNRGENLFECIETVVNQTYAGKIEHVLMSDRSPFVQANRARLLEKNPNLTIIDVDQEKLKEEVIACFIPSRLSWIRNCAVQASQGDYVCYLDDDNKLSPDHIESLVEAIESELDIDIAYCWRQMVWEDGTPWIEEEYPWTPQARLATSKEALSSHIYEELVRAGVRTPGSNIVKDTVISEDGQQLYTVDQGEFLVKKDVHLTIPLTVKYPWRKMTGDYSDDHDFIERAYLAGCRFKCTEKATLYYTIGGCSQTQKKEMIN